MSVLRKALDDSARAARYIETVPKRGYRFIAPVRESDVTNPVKSVAVLPFLNLVPPTGASTSPPGSRMR
jgi:DNA-binding winged helix-turn-helix (wHTH) protein